jgi:hypothetical protein
MKPQAKYLLDVELHSRRSDFNELYLWPRTPLTPDHQQRIIERVGVSDYQVNDPRSRTSLIINAISLLIKLKYIDEHFCLLDIACGDAIVLWQIKKHYQQSDCYGVDCNLSFPVHTKARADGCQINFGFIQHLFALAPLKAFDLSIMLNTYRGWESADLRQRDINLPQMADRWFELNSRFTIITATTKQIVELRKKGFSLVPLGKGEDDATMVIMSARNTIERLSAFRDFWEYK